MRLEESESRTHASEMLYVMHDDPVVEAGEVTQFKDKNKNRNKRRWKTQQMGGTQASRGDESIERDSKGQQSEQTNRWEEWKKEREKHFRGFCACVYWNFCRTAEKEPRRQRAQ